MDASETIDINTMPVPSILSSPEISDAPNVGATAWVLQTTQVRLEPSDKKELLAKPSGNKKARRANWLATLNRGEQLTIVAAPTDDAWLNVKTSDEKLGWVRTEHVLWGAHVVQATVLQAAKCFVRPDLLALAGARQIEAGSLVFVLRDKDMFSEINTHQQSTAWVLSSLLDTSPAEVEVAKLLHRARFLNDHNDKPGADALLDLARTHFAQTQLVMRLLSSPTADTNVGETLPGQEPMPAMTNNAGHLAGDTGFAPDPSSAPPTAVDGAAIQPPPQSVAP